MAVMSFDVARVRGLYPTLGTTSVHLDGPLGTLQPESVVRAIIATLRASPAQPGSRSARSKRSERSAAQARSAVADLVGARPSDVMLGTSEGSLLTRLATLTSRNWTLGDEIVLSRMDSDLVRLPWSRAARAAGAVVRWAEIDLETGELPTWQYERLINDRTKIVTVPLANPATGTVPQVRAIADLAHAHGAIVIVDAGAALPYLPVDILDLGADAVTLSAATFGGPTVAAMAARPGLLISLDAGNAQRLEFGPLPVELLDGLTAAVDHLAGLTEQEDGTRRERLIASITEAGEYSRYLYEYLDERLRRVPDVTVLGSSSDRLPLLAFTVAGRTPDQVGDYLERSGISAWTGPSGMSELLATFGADELGGATFVGLMPHSTVAEIEQLINAIEALVY